jgi:DNA polymerase III subunit gamma/tau
MPDQRSLLPSGETDGSRLAGASNTAREEYVVVARRYRPQLFEEVIGQEHVTRALENAISTGRIGHAFLFTGARGTGKTSTARILAKALNCVTGPTPKPCNQCDICTSISTGDDVDALEIDGASNRRIEEIRQLRQNVNIRPSRSRFKIYIIDEVHMLTHEAFNALLKTLEEPPEHVKFIFCTTEPEKIPITILSRCQRYDFAGVQMAAIVQRLAQICEAEGIEAEPEALNLLARRAAGSMRDSQSLLEQLMAFGDRMITVADVHELLGTAGSTRLAAIVGHLADRNSTGALAELDAAIKEGVDVGQLLDQLLGHFRDLMVAAAGCPADALLYSSAGEFSELVESGRRLGMEAILAMMQVVDSAMARLRYSTHPRTLAELALVRICTLEQVESLSALVAGLKENGGRSPTTPTTGKSAAGGTPRNEPVAQTESALKKKWGEVASSSGSGGGNGASARPAEDVAQDVNPIAAELGDSSAEELAAAWEVALGNVGGLIADSARNATLAVRGTNQVVATFPSSYNFLKEQCERNARVLESALSETLSRTIRLQFALAENGPPPAASPPSRAEQGRKQTAAAMEHPLVKRASELFGARVVWVEEPQA